MEVLLQALSIASLDQRGVVLVDQLELGLRRLGDHLVRGDDVPRVDRRSRLVLAVLDGDEPVAGVADLSSLHQLAHQRGHLGDARSDLRGELGDSTVERVTVDTVLGAAGVGAVAEGVLDGPTDVVDRNAHVETFPDVNNAQMCRWIATLNGASIITCP